ncbi:hypothetical protein Ciccas_012945 [Cichlidogyrus casuarinus]|uniref:XK-related protein n=1 Tax=Cichlidogyrus casuarinus TaxID=1844966 RepID=A0ABD2PNC2_9PLAT
MASFLILNYCLISYQMSLVKKSSFRSAVSYMVWKYCFLIFRMLSFVLFATLVRNVYLVIIIALHWLICYLILTEWGTTFHYIDRRMRSIPGNKATCVMWFYCSLADYLFTTLYIFDVVDVRAGKKFARLCLFMFLENTVFFLVWYFRSNVS